jgi:hypothetical protein
MIVLGAYPWLLCLLSPCLSVISAQMIFPSNASDTTLSARKFTLEAAIGDVRRLVELDPLTDQAGAAGDLERLKVSSPCGPIIPTCF